MITDDLQNLGKSNGQITVSLSNELVQLLSDQLYSSPLKAIEELVVNAYDANASNCAVFFPNLSGMFSKQNKIIVFDDGEGMDIDGLTNLWQIGRSNKRQEEISKRSSRKLIGKFGIGKLATYSIANEITYISKSSGKINSVSLDYNSFSSSGTGAGRPINLPVLEITDLDKFYESDLIQTILGDTCLIGKINLESLENWTIVILQNLKTRASGLKMGRLRWVLSSAMPINDTFALSLNCEIIESSKLSFNRIADFKVTEISPDRFKKLIEKTGLNWSKNNETITSSLFPNGVSGQIIVTERSLQEGKSTDLGRSNGFFVRVRNRLVNITDSDFGLTLPSTETFARFRADIEADDLDAVITAPREGVESSELKDRFQELLSMIYNEARSRYEEYLRTQQENKSRNKEGEREHVLPQLVEYPIADVISRSKIDPQSGTEADDTWFYFNMSEIEDISALAVELYAEPRKKYSYQYNETGRSQRIVEFNAKESTFWINEDHEFVKAHNDNPRSRVLLEDIVTAEALLEIYLRERNIPNQIIGEILEKRDKLLRGLAKDHPYSNNGIASELRDSSSNDHELEVNLVIAMRALGFTATHIAGANEPDGIARFTDNQNREQILTLEAKSSQKVPQLSQFDFAGLHEHSIRHNAQGCLLLAPSYPGLSRANDSSAAVRAREAKISCWTIDQLCSVLIAADNRHITAKDIYDIVINKYTPDDVQYAIDELLSATTIENRILYVEIITALKEMKDLLPDAPRNIHQISIMVARSLKEKGHQINQKNISKALRELSGASKGGLIILEDDVIINVSLEELERKASDLTGEIGKPLENSSFRE